MPHCKHINKDPAKAVVLLKDTFFFNIRDQKFKYKGKCLHAAFEFNNQVEITECCKNKTAATVPL